MTGNSFSVSGYGPERAGWTRVFARDSLARRLDWPILLSAIGLSLIGSLLVFSATRNRTEINQGDQYYFLIRHLMNTGIGIALMIGVIWVGHRTLRVVVPFLYGASVFGILLVLTPLGSTVNGAHSWIVLGGGFSLQPSEFVKITIILGMAMILAARVDAGDKPYPDHRTVLQALGLASVPMMIVMLMPDLGSVMVMVIIVLGVLLASGASNRWRLQPLGLRPPRRGHPGRDRRVAAALPGRVPDRPLRRLRQPEPRPGGRRLQHQPGPHRDRFRRPHR